MAIELKKRIDLRVIPELLKSKEETEKVINEIVPKEAKITNIWFDDQRSVLYIEAKNPEVVIGKGGKSVKEITKRTFWKVVVKRAPSIKSALIDEIRKFLYYNSEYRKKFLHEVGKKINRDWSRDEKYYCRASFLGGFREVGRSAILIQTPESSILLDCGVNVAVKGIKRYPRIDVKEFNLEKLDAVIVSHAHLDHSGFLPYLFRLGWKGPVYVTEPTRDLMALLQLDYIDVSFKRMSENLYTSKEISEMIKHTITVDYEVVTDIAPDIKLTFFNAGHILGSAMIHLNIGKGFHNVLYTADFKYGPTGLLEKAVTKFQRLETLFIESTYGSKEDIQEDRKESEAKLIRIMNETIARGGKVLIPVLGVGRAQDVELIIYKAIKEGKLPKDITIYIDGMVWDINALHAAYPEFMKKSIRKLFERDKNPFLNENFKRVGSMEEREKVVKEDKPSVIVATSGMLVGGPSVYYFKKLANDKKNAMIFVSYQAEGSLGREVQEGKKEITVEGEEGNEIIKVDMDVYTVKGFSGHSDINQILSFIKNLTPSPRRIIIGHGENKKCLELSSNIHKNFKIETSAPRVIDSLRLK